LRSRRQTDGPVQLWGSYLGLAMRQDNSITNLQDICTAIAIWPWVTGADEMNRMRWREINDSASYKEPLLETFRQITVLYMSRMASSHYAIPSVKRRLFSLRRLPVRRCEGWYYGLIQMGLGQSEMSSLSLFHNSQLTQIHQARCDRSSSWIQLFLNRFRALLPMFSLPFILPWFTDHVHLKRSDWQNRHLMWTAWNPWSVLFDGTDWTVWIAWAISFQMNW
jgi:hypothetical protein